MWSITVQPPGGYSSNIFGGIGNNIWEKRPGDELGGQGAVYIITVNGLGSIFLEDVGHIEGGTGYWALQVNGTSSYWFFDGFGQAALSVDIDGNFSLGGGVAVSGKVITNMQDTGPLTQKMLVMLNGAPFLQPQWNADPLNTLYMMGFPRTSMYNMDADCCRQFVEILQSIQFPTTAEGALGSGWFQCAGCKALYAGLIAAAAVGIIALIVGSGGTAAPLLLLEESASVAAIAVATGISVARVAQLAAAAFAASGATSFIGSFVENLCKENGYCD